MIKYLDSEVLSGINNRYMLINAVAKRAREMVEYRESEVDSEFKLSSVNEVLRELQDREIEIVEVNSEVNSEVDSEVNS